MSNAETLKRFYNAMEQHDWNTKRGMIWDDFHFRGPLLQTNTADDFISGVTQFNCDVKFTDVEMIERGDTVMSFFTFNIAKPFTGSFRMAEKVQFRQGRIQSSELIYDARPFPVMKPA
jgi:hypothetical protein